MSIRRQHTFDAGSPLGDTCAFSMSMSLDLPARLSGGAETAVIEFSEMEKGPSCVPKKLQHVSCPSCFTGRLNHLLIIMLTLLTVAGSRGFASFFSLPR